MLKLVLGTATPASSSSVRRQRSDGRRAASATRTLARCVVVLDPFGGAGTVGLVANRLGRDAVIVELNAEYADMARRRIEDDSPLFSQVTVA